MLDQITPLILTYNEGPNIGRSLDQLRWAQDIIIVDSLSNDDTLNIASEFSQVRTFQREFDSHESQWNFGLTETGISTEWVLALDSDYILTEPFVAELNCLHPQLDTGGYVARFVYCINGQKLRSGIYPPSIVLFRHDRGSYRQDGHTQKLTLQGGVERLDSPILHDDRKPLRRWLHSQIRYTRLEAQKLLTVDNKSLSWTDRIRRLRLVAPLAICFYCLVVRGGILDGRAGFFYAFQRTVAELMLSLYLIEYDLGLATREEKRVENKELVASEKKRDAIIS